LDETGLIAAARGGEEKAFRLLYEATVDRIYRLVFRIVGDESIAADLTQDTFVRAFQKLDQFRGEAAFTSWVHRIAVSVALNRLETIRETVPLESEQSALVRDSEPEPDLRERLGWAIGQLSPDSQVVFLMHDLEGYTHEEIGQVLGVATGTSKARLSRARADLRELLGDAMREYMR
jgi:RNA polymerase sigma-70 factor (ECF subfamily)